MSKSLRDMLLELVEEREGTNRDFGKKMVYAYWPEIKALLEEGWHLTDICETLQKKVGVKLKYSAIRYHIRRLQKKEAGLNNSSNETCVMHIKKDELKEVQIVVGRTNVAQYLQN